MADLSFLHIVSQSKHSRDRAKDQSESWQNVLDSERNGPGTNASMSVLRLQPSHPVEQDGGRGGVLSKTERISVFSAFRSAEF